MANASACFFPDQTTTGAQTDPQFVPCDPSAPASACCAVGESCLESGYCYSGNGQLYRGACTDKTWNDDACPHECNQSPTSMFACPKRMVLLGMWLLISKSRFVQLPNALLARYDGSSGESELGVWGSSFYGGGSV